MNRSSRLKNLGITLLLVGSLVGGVISSGHADDSSSNSSATTSSAGVSGFRAIRNFFKHLFSVNLAQLNITNGSSSSPNAPTGESSMTPSIQTPIQAPIQPPPPLEVSPSLPITQTSAIAPPAVVDPLVAQAAATEPRASISISLSPSISPNSSTDQHKHEAIIFGGVDDEKTETSIFRDSFVSLATAFKQKNWDVQVLFGNQRSCANCSSPFSVDPIAAAAGVASSQIPKASLEQLEAKLDDALTNLSQGDELLLEINTHGIVGINPARETSVSLAVYDESDPTGALVNQLENGRQHGAMLIDDPALTQRLQNLKDKGVKIAISDDSCFGGPAAQRLAKYGCILTQTSDKYGLGSPISDSYVDALNTSGPASMDDIFLDSLSRGTYGIKSPYYTPPYAGVLEPQFSATLDQYTAIQNLSGVWLPHLKGNYLTIQNGQMALSGNVGDFSALENYSSQYLAPFVDSSKDGNYLAIAQGYMKKNKRYILQDEIPAPTQLAKMLGNLGQSLQTAADQYNQIVQQEQSLEASLQQSGLVLNIQLPSDYSDGQAAFDSAVQALNGDSLYSFSGWLTYPISSDKLMAFFEPSNIRFKVNISFSVMRIAQQMASTYPEASSADFKDKLNAAIITAETQAWSSASSDQKTALRSIQQMIELKKQEPVFLGLGAGDKIVSYGILARMYSYLSFRDRAGQSNTDINACASFNLRAL